MKIASTFELALAIITTLLTSTSARKSHDTPDVNVGNKMATRESNTNSGVNLSSEAEWVWDDIFGDDWYYYYDDPKPDFNADELETKTSFYANKSELDTTTEESLKKSNLRGSKIEETLVSVSDVDAYNDCKKECANTYGSGIPSYYRFLNCLGQCPSPYGDDDYIDDFFVESSFVATNSQQDLSANESEMMTERSRA